MKARLFCILARESRNALIIRRGPSKQVCLIKWNRKDDTFEEGQWFKGRIYERRCDLSPDGEKLLYFAASWKPKSYMSWTAVSRPPYLTAIILWPKGDAWGGGGAFKTDNIIQLNHGPHEMEPGKEFKLPKNVKVIPHGNFSGRGEDNPSYDGRLERDGWKLIQTGIWKETGRSDKIWVRANPAEIYAKSFKFNSKQIYTLQMITKGIKENQGSWYVIDYNVLDSNGNILLTLEKTDWADWDNNGDLLFAMDGMIFRLKPKLQKKGIFDFENAKQIIDLNDLKFKEKISPAAARKW